MKNALKNNIMATEIWEKAFEVSIGNTKEYAKRLRELLTWDKPITDKSNDVSGKWNEWAIKCLALENLIREKHPHMKITLDNKIILSA
jgi:hypothetical protein